MSGAKCKSDGGCLAQQSNIAWPRPIQFVVLSFVAENELAMSPIRAFYSSIVEHLQTMSKDQLFDALQFAKVPSRLLFVRDLRNGEEVEHLIQELIDQSEADPRSDVLYVVHLYRMEDEEKVLELAQKLVAKNFLAVAAFNKTYAEPVKRSGGGSVLSMNQKKSQEIKCVSRSLLYDIVQVIGERKRILNERHLEKASPMGDGDGVSAFMTEDEDDTGMETSLENNTSYDNNFTDRQLLTAEAVALAPVQSSLGFRLAEQFNVMGSQSRDHHDAPTAGAAEPAKFIDPRAHRVTSPRQLASSTNHVTAPPPQLASSAGHVTTPPQFAASAKHHVTTPQRVAAPTNHVTAPLQQFAASRTSHVTAAPRLARATPTNHVTATPPQFAGSAGIRTPATLYDSVAFYQTLASQNSAAPAPKPATTATMVHSVSNPNLNLNPISGSGFTGNSTGTVEKRQRRATNSAGTVEKPLRSAAVAVQPAEKKSFRIDHIPTFKQMTLTPGKLYDVVVSHVTDNAEFYVQFYAHCKFLEYLTFRLNAYYALLEENDSMLPYEKIREAADITDIWCSAPFAVNESLLADTKQYYYRAKLQSRISTTVYEVQFVDYGNVTRVPFTSLKILPESFRPVGGLAVHCRLKEEGINADLLRKKVESNTCCVLRIEKMNQIPYVVTLLQTDDGCTEENVAETVLREQRSKQGPPNKFSVSAGRGHRKSGARM